MNARNKKPIEMSIILISKKNFPSSMHSVSPSTLIIPSILLHVSHKKQKQQCSFTLILPTLLTSPPCKHARTVIPPLHRPTANDAVSNPRCPDFRLVDRLSSLSINRFSAIMLDVSWLRVILVLLEVASVYIPREMDGATPFEENFPDYSQQPLPSLSSTLLQGKNQDNLNVHSIQVKTK